MLPKPGLHPRNRHVGRYDFAKLIQRTPELGRFISTDPAGDSTLDFTDPEAVRSLNRALLLEHYGVTHWSIPENYLCPPIPGRADYIHYLADLLAEQNAGVIPRGMAIRVLDVGVGANCVYPIIGHAEYGWSFVGTDIDPVAIASAKLIAQSNKILIGAVEVRSQPSPGQMFKGVVQGDEVFHASICNPPFHSSLGEATQSRERKWKGLGKAPATRSNFGGQSTELWCAGGEIEFVRKMIQESEGLSEKIGWFSTLISKADHLPLVHRALKAAGALHFRTIEMAQGQKRSRIVAWTFQSPTIA